MCVLVKLSGQGNKQTNKGKEGRETTSVIMPLFGGKKKPESKKAEEVVKPRTPTVEDKYDLKDVLGT